ncbi:MAG: hypothetical protein GX879_09705 [Bacteroidales bacterium]|nr:hypothetical protein [Bacteroidales bacterium]
MDLNNQKWSEYKIGSIFKVSRGRRLIEKDRIPGTIQYYSASATNNGLTDFISNPLFIEINCIIVTTFLDAYYVNGEFTASDEITMLKNNYLNKYNAKFIVRSIIANKDKFAFGYKAFTERIKRQTILLPTNSQGEPDYVFMEAYMRAKEKEILNRYKIQLEEIKELTPLEEKKWKEFFIDDVLEIISGIDIYQSERVEGDIPYISATSVNNGIGHFISNKNKTIESNCLSVNRNGSVGYSFFHPYKALFSNDCRKLRLKHTNSKHVGIFLSMLITHQKDKYGYGYKMGTARLKKQKILLPVNENQEPDYEYMENYMRFLENKKLEEYLNYKQVK